MENDTIEEDNALSHLAKTVTDRVPNKFDYHVQFEAQLKDDCIRPLLLGVPQDERSSS